MSYLYLSISQGETLKELEENIQEAYSLIIADEQIASNKSVMTKEVALEIS